MSIRLVRRLFQVTVAAAALATGVAVAAGWSIGSIETFCPFGGLETLGSVLTDRRFSCSAGEANLALFVALLGLTLVARKAFCAWVCPVGAVAEGLAWLGRRLRRAPATKRCAAMVEPPRRVDRVARWLRLVVLALVLGFTWQVGELVFRPYDPYYVLFSAHGHDVQPWSYALLAVLLAGAVVVAMAWCRYLCPLGGVLWPFSATARLRVRRTAAACTGCKACSVACPHGLDVAGVDDVRSGECTLCLECTAACQAPGALAVGTRTRKVSPWIVPALVVVATVLGLTGARLFAMPSFTRTFGTGGEAPTEVTFVVEGLRCVDTARRVAAQLEGVPGVVDFTAYASRRRARIVYDARQVDPAALQRAIEGPVYDAATGEFRFHQFRVVAIDTP